MASQGASPLVDGGGDDIVKKTSSSNWAKVFKKRVDNILYFLWYTTNEQGQKLPRGGQIVGTVNYPNLAAAEANVPLNYSAEVFDNPNIYFEQNTLRGLIDGLVDVANNKLGLEVFPDTPVTTGGDYGSYLWWQDAGLFRGNAQKILALGLADAFDHNQMFDTTEMPTANRATWNNNFPESYASVDNAYAELQGGNEYGYMYYTRIDKSFNPVHYSFGHLDIESAGWTAERAAYFTKGYHQAAIAVDPNHVTIFYGKPIREFKAFWRMGSYHYPPFDSVPVSQRMKLFPFILDSINYQTLSGLTLPYFANKNVYFNTLFNYPNACMPLTTAMYKKVDGVIQLVDGERDFVDHGFDENVRGINYHWEPNEGHEGDPVDDNQGPYKNYIHEAYCAVYAAYAHYASSVFELRALQGTNDITNTLNGPYKTCWMIRTTCEGNPFQSTYRPLDRYTSKLWNLMGHVLSNRVALWSGWTETTGFTDNGNPNFPASSEGQPYQQASIEGYDVAPKTVNLSFERQSLAIHYYIKTINRDYGLFSSSDKLLTFTDPFMIQSRAEIMGTGRLKDNKIFLVLAEPRHEIGESMQITIGNTKNSTKFTRTLYAKQILDEVFVFPSDTYTPANIWIEYQTIKAVDVKVSGDLQSHDI